MPQAALYNKLPDYYFTLFKHKVKKLYPEQENENFFIPRKVKEGVLQQPVQSVITCHQWRLPET